MKGPSIFSVFVLSGNILVDSDTLFHCGQVATSNQEKTTVSQSIDQAWHTLWVSALRHIDVAWSNREYQWAIAVYRVYQAVCWRAFEAATRQDLWTIGTNCPVAVVMARGHTRLPIFRWGSRDLRWNVAWLCEFHLYLRKFITSYFLFWWNPDEPESLLRVDIQL